MAVGHDKSGRCGACVAVSILTQFFAKLLNFDAFLITQASFQSFK